MATKLLSILTFPQKFENGKLYFNVLFIPRNINPLKALQNGRPAFSDANISFKSQIIDSLDGAPYAGNISKTLSPTFESDASGFREVWEALAQQIEKSENVKVTDEASADPNQQAEADFQKYKNVSIKKYLPISYRKSFHFTKARTKYVVTDDEYTCAIKNKKIDQIDEPTHRDTISWGKLVAYCLRNPKLAEKAGLIYKMSIELNEDEFEKGGWIYTELAEESDIFGVESMNYAARIPALKEIREAENQEDRKRNIFAAVLFPILAAPGSFGGYDRIFAEAIHYDDGFAKIVHARQPINQDLLQESDKSNPPLKDIGIQLGWDDEQIPIWFNRQMLRKEEVSDTPVDTPLGVFSYAIDVKKTEDENWCSQNEIFAHTDILLNGEIPVIERNEALELGTEVHPVAHGNSKKDGFWIPMYFTNWIGKPLSIPDQEAAEISMLENVKVIPFKELKQEIDGDYDPVNDDNSNNLVPKPVFYPYGQSEGNRVELRYGNQYQFRVRLLDISGGGPTIQDDPQNGGQNPISNVFFKRHIQAGAMMVENVHEIYNAQEFEPGDIPVREIDASVLENLISDESPFLKIKRPLLAYPAVVFTGKYADPVGQLKSILSEINPNEKTTEIGLPDPDVDYFKVLVDIKSLEMDNNVLSESGKENYYNLYEKEFKLAEAVDDFSQTFHLKIVYRDFSQIDYKSGILENAAEDELLLPTSRNLRIRILPVIKQADGNYGDEMVAEGKQIILKSFKAASDETNLLSPINGGFRSFYLQPEKRLEPMINLNKLTHSNSNLSPILVKQFSKTSVELAKIANELNLIAKNMTIEGEKGNRVQFGCSKEIRHSLAPDSSSVTISENSELFNQWINVIDFNILRDWGWDALKVESIQILRQLKNEKAESYGPQEVAGTIRISNTANIHNLLGEVKRDQIRFVFFDVVDPKKLKKEFPDEILVRYRIKLNFKEEFSETKKDKEITEILHLPITIIPQQIPKLVSAGIALTPYTYDQEKYSYTNPRQRFLWLEFEEPPQNPDDTYFVRVLNNAPDPLICRVNSEILNFENEDMPFNLDDEKMRIIIPGMDNDYAGIGVMQEMIAEELADGKTGTIYMVPLPPGMHESSDELFGFFNYEIRLGHKKESWSTAQGRFGRPLKVNSVQHPAPDLACNAYRNAKLIYKTQILNGRPIKKRKTIKELIITAPFANAVLNGKNVAAFPPQTSLWYLLYTQVLQADGKSYRNFLIDSGNMPYKVKKRKIIQDLQSPFVKEDGNRNGTAVIPVQKIREKLQNLNLPKNSPISVLAVEMFPMDNSWQFLEGKGRILEANNRVDEYFVNQYEDRVLENPLTKNLGSFRIYRSSPLVALEDICCDDC